MAANIFTILNEWARGQNAKPADVLHALSYAPGCDNLDIDDWGKLCKAAGYGKGIPETALKLRTKYLRRWRDLGQPATAEAWRDAWLARPQATGG